MKMSGDLCINDRSQVRPPHVQIDHRGAEAFVTEQPTDRQQVDTRFEQSGRVGMPQRVGRDRFANARFLHGGFARFLNRGGT